jgi:hypothetical protein
MGVKETEGPELTGNIKGLGKETDQALSCLKW